MEEKKPKRPRIGALPTTSENTENKDQYFQSRPYKGTERPDFGQRGFQPRPRTYQNSYSNSYRSNTEEGGYNRQTRSSYQQRQNNYNRNYQNVNSSDENGYKRYGSNSDSDSQTRSSENTYQQTQSEGGYQQNRQNSYNRQGGNQGGYNRQNNYNRQGGNRQQGGYNRQGGNQGGYQNRQQGGYNRQGGNHGSYQNRQQGGFNRQGGNQGGYQKRQQSGFQKNQKPGMKFMPRPRQIDYVIDDIDPNEPIRLNKFMANSGICSRREADEKITAGLVTVNDVVVTELGTKINRDDVVKCED
ncbi:MAG: pseudouridine synthase, partial [Muribaculaceae bacterium]|nr:pseudouridine synthase [Muribaculaceae bacterium]